MKKLFLLLALLLASPLSVHAAVGTIYVDTGGCESTSTTRCSGTTDSASATVSGASATITCSATTYTGSTPGCSLSGSPDLSGVATDGSQAIYLNCATNSGQKIFWITAVDDGADLVQTTGTPTGCSASTSDWGIGGRIISPGTNVVPPWNGTLRAGDTLQFNNTPATKSTVPYVTPVNSGDSTTGKINIIGKSGVRPVLQTTANANAITASTPTNVFISNLEIVLAGTAAGLVIQTGAIADNVKITGSGGSTTQHGISTTNLGWTISNSEIGPVGGSGISVATNSNAGLITGNYIHDAGVDCIAIAGTVPNTSVVGNVLDTCAGRGIQVTGASTTQNSILNIFGNTIYGNGNSGIEVADADTALSIRNNIVVSTTTAVSTVKWAAGNAGFTSNHAYNVFWNSADGNSGLSGITINSTEVAADPAMANPASASFTIGNSSPAANAGFFGTLPIAGGSVGYRDVGAFQRNASAGGGASCIGC